MRERRLTVHGDVTWLEPLRHIGIPDLVGGCAHHHSGDNHVVRDCYGLGLSSGSRGEVVELRKGNDSANTKHDSEKNAYSDLGFGFVLS